MKLKTLLICVLVIVQILPTFASECKPPQLNYDQGIGWTKDALDGNDAPFKQIRHEIDAQIKQGVNARGLAKKYNVIAQQQYLNAEEVFRWAYAAYIAGDHWNRNVRSTNDYCGIYERMGRPKNPRSFEYARLRLFMSRYSEHWISFGNYADLARRLLAMGNKNDFDLRYYAIEVIASNMGSKTLKLLEEVFKLVLDLRKDFPKRPETIYQMGGIYASRFAASKRDELANLSIQYTRQYLATKPSNPAMVRSANSRIKLVESLRGKFKKSGELKP